MNNSEILEAAIKKAEKNGYKFPKMDAGADHYDEPIYHDKWNIVAEKLENVIIFSHEFAKAFWGEEAVCRECLSIEASKEPRMGDHLFTKCEEEFKELRWAYHLQQMVLEEDPIKYLEQFLDKNDT